MKTNLEMEMPKLNDIYFFWKDLFQILALLSNLVSTALRTRTYPYPTSSKNNF